MFRSITLALLLGLSSSSFSQAKNSYIEVTLPEAMKLKQKGDPNMVIIDVRSPGEYGDTAGGKSGHIGRIKGAINVNVQDLQSKPEAVKSLEQYKDKEVYLIC